MSAPITLSALTSGGKTAIALAMRTVLVLGLLIAGPALSASSEWRNIDDLPEGDRQAAQAALAPMFGEDATLWPDWLEVDGAYVSSLWKGRPALLLRFPMKMDCGPWGYLFLGPSSRDGARARLGDSFCANEITLTDGFFQPLPDIQFDRQGVQDADGNWSFETVRWHWDGGQWRRSRSAN